MVSTLEKVELSVFELGINIEDIEGQRKLNVSAWLCQRCHGRPSVGSLAEITGPKIWITIRGFPIQPHGFEKGFFKPKSEFGYVDRNLTSNLITYRRKIRIWIL